MWVRLRFDIAWSDLAAGFRACLLALLVVEDCAQAYCGTEFDGHPDADVAIFSFGPIKTATASGGGLLRVRDGELLSQAVFLPWYPDLPDLALQDMSSVLRSQASSKNTPMRRNFS
jgi:dTDP-4-amino-4,6-dideoxygalactose transaminase